MNRLLTADEVADLLVGEAELGVRGGAGGPDPARAAGPLHALQPESVRGVGGGAGTGARSAQPDLGRWGTQEARRL